MRVCAEGPFHVNCHHTSRSICYCLEGTPASLSNPAAAATYYHNAQQLHDYVSDPASSLYGADTVEVLMPRLLRRERTVSYPTATGALSGPFSPYATATETGLNGCSNFMDERSLARSTLVQRPQPEKSNPAAPSIPPPSNQAAQPQRQDMLHANAPLGSAHPQANNSNKQRGILEQQPKFAQMLSLKEFDALRKQATPTTTGSGNPPVPVLDVPSLQSIQDSVKAALQGIARNIPGFPQGYIARGPRKRAPPKTWRLAICDVRPALVGKMVQVLWPQERQWWPGAIMDVSVNQGTASLIYETGERKEGVELVKLIQAGHVAWLDGPESTSLKGGAGSKRTRKGSPVVVADPPISTRPQRIRKNSAKFQRSISPEQEEEEEDHSESGHSDGNNNNKNRGTHSAQPSSRAGSQVNQHHNEQQQQQQHDDAIIAVSGSMPPPLPVPTGGSPIIPYLISLGTRAAGMDVMLSVQGRWLPTKVSDVNQQDESIMLTIGARSVVLKGSDEGSRYTLFLPS